MVKEERNLYCSVAGAEAWWLKGGAREEASKEQFLWWSFKDVGVILICQFSETEVYAEKYI